MINLDDAASEQKFEGNMLDHNSQMSLGTDEIRSLLWDVGGKVRKEELYFRN